MTTMTTMTTCRQRVMLFLTGVLVIWSCAGAAQGVGGKRFDVRGTVVDSGGWRVGDALVVLIDSGRDDPVDWDRPEDHPGALVTRADMHGVFVLAEVPGMSYWLYARSGHGQVHVRRIGFHDDPPPPYDVHLSMTEIEGTVYWPDSRTPVIGAIVGLEYDYFVTRTDEHGTFRFAGVEPKEYAVFVRARLPLTPRDIAAAEAFATATRRGVSDSVTQGFEEIVVESKVTVEPDGPTQLTMLLHGGVVRGVVTTDAGTPAAGVLVTGGGRARHTDHAGRFELTHVPVGSCRLAVLGRNYETRRMTVDVAPGEDATRVEITLYPFCPQVTFHFATPNREVLAHERVRCVWRRLTDNEMAATGGRRGFKTDDHGQWQDQWMDSGARDYLFFSTTFGCAWQTVIIGEGVREVHHEITLTPGGSICGIARDQLTGAPLGGVVLRPVRVGADGMGDSQSMWNGLMGGRHNRLVYGYPITQVSRDGDGTFCLTNLPPGRYRIGIRGAGLGEQYTLEDAEDLSGVEIVVATRLAQRWVVGRVLGPDNAPVANTEVTFVMDYGGPPGPFGLLGGVPRRAVTDVLGLFRVGPLDARRYRLSAWTPGHRSESIPIDVTAESIDAGDLQLVPVEGW